MTLYKSPSWYDAPGPGDCSPPDELDEDEEREARERRERAEEERAERIMEVIDGKSC